MSTTRRVAWLLGSLVLGHSRLLHAADIAAAQPGTSTNGFKPLVKDDRPAAPILAPASNEGEVRIKQFKLTPGLKVDLWAAEPMLANPVAFSVDERGRVFTSETYRYRTSVLDIRHYMFMLEDDLASRSIEDRLAYTRKWFGPEGEQALGREAEVIRLLEDTDGDHKADKSSVFADGLNSPLDGIASGVLARHGEVWFTDIPSVWKFSPSQPGADSPPKPNTPLASRPTVHAPNYTAEELLRGFGVRFSFTGHDLHGLKFGPDGRLYFSCGDRGAHIVTKEGTVIDLPDEGAVFRCEPDGSNLEVVHRGLRNPQELAFNEYGDLFTGDNDSDQGDRERWVQVIEGADSGWRVGHQHAPLGNAGMWNMERLWVPHFEGQAAYLMPPIANLGDGPSGLVYDYGTSLPEELKGRFLLAYFKGTSAKSGLYSLKVRPAGASYELVAHDEFVWNSLVPDVDLAPDGAILFADWHEGWPKSNKGRLYRAHFPGVIADPVAQETAKVLGEGFAKRSEKELLGLLAHRDMRVRQEAQFELAARGPKSFDGLKQVAFDSKNQFARLHAIWGIGQLDRAAAPDEELVAKNNKALRGFGNDTPTHHRKSFSLVSPQLASLLRLASDKDPLVRANTLKLFGNTSNAAFYRELVKGMEDGSPGVRLAAMQALRSFLASSRHGGFIGFGRWSTPKWPREHTFPARPLGAVLGKNADLTPVVINAASSLLAEELDFRTGDRKEIYDWARKGGRNPQLALLLAERRLGWPEVAKFLSDPDPLLVLEAARAINDVPITNALPALSALAEPAKLDALLKQFAALRIVEQAPPPAAPTGGGARRTATAGAAMPPAIRDVRADQPLPWTNAPIDHLTPILLRVVNANFRVGTPETAQRLASLATRTDLSDLIRTEALFALGTWAKPHQRDRIVGTYRPLPGRDAQPAREALGKALPVLLPQSATGLQPAEPSAPGKTADDAAHKTAATPAGSKPAAPSEAVLIAATEAIASLKLTDATPRLVAVVKDSAAPATARAAALRAFTQLETRNSELETLLAFAAKDSAEPLRLAASKLSAELNPNDAAGQLVAKLTAGSLAEQQSAFTSLGDLKSEAADAILAEWMDKLMKREVANEVMLDLVDAAAKRDAGAVKSRLETYAKWKLPQDHLTPYREALFGGDAARGRKIFYENPAVACTRCHQVAGDGGGNAGPKLDGLANRVTREHLLESIVFPNQQVMQGFATVLLSLKNGTSYAGILKAETDTELNLVSPEDGELKLKKADIASRDTGLSGMPEGFGQLLSKQELRDVIEFLGTLK